MAIASLQQFEIETETSPLFTTRTASNRNRNKPIVYDNNCINAMQVETDETYSLSLNRNRNKPIVYDNN